MQWQTIDTAPAWESMSSGKDILCGFMGQFKWISFVAPANGKDTALPNYAKPTHWMPIVTPDSDAMEIAA